MINKTQLVVKTDARTIEWLEREGYVNMQHLPEKYGFPVFVVDFSSKTFGGTNTTCMAAACSCGNRPIALTFEQLQAKLKNATADSQTR